MFTSRELISVGEFSFGADCQMSSVERVRARHVNIVSDKCMSQLVDLGVIIIYVLLFCPRLKTLRDVMASPSAKDRQIHSKSKMASHFLQQNQFNLFFSRRSSRLKKVCSLGQLVYSTHAVSHHGFNVYARKRIAPRIALINQKLISLL